MNFKTTIVLLVLVVLGGGLWFFTGSRPEATEKTDADKQDAKPKEHYVLEPRVERDDVVRVEFQRADKPALVFSREPKPGQVATTDWRMVQPLDSETEGYTVGGLVTMLTGLQYQRSFDPGAKDGVSAADAGLEPPAATLTLTDKEGNAHAVELGKRAALSNDMYIRVVGQEQILVVGRDMTREIERDADEYRAKRLLKFTPTDAKRVQIAHAGVSYDLVKSDAGEWLINTPVKAYALGDKVDGLIRALSSLRVKKFVEDAPDVLGSFGLEPAYLTISVTTSEKELVAEEPQPEGEEEPTSQPAPRFETVERTYALAVGQFADLKSESRFVKLGDQPWVASVEDQQLEKLVPKPAELRDPVVTRVKAAEITRLEIADVDGTTVLEKQDGRWQGTGDLADLDADAIDKLLSAFQDLRAIDFIDSPRDLAEYGLDEPRVTLTVTTSDSVEPLALRIGADTASGRNTYVQLAGQASVLVVSAERIKPLAVRPISLRSRAITSGKPDQIKWIELKRGPRRFVLERAADGKTWQMLEPADAPPDPAGVRELVNDLSRLRANDVVAKGEGAAYGLSEPAMTIRFVMEQPVEIAGPPTTPGAAAPTERVEHTLVIGRVSNQTYARIDDVPFVFQLDETVFASMSQELIRRGLFDIDAEQVVGLKIEAPGGTVEFSRENDQWVYPADKYLKLSQKKVGDFVKDLAGLRVTGFVAVSYTHLTLPTN